MGTARPDVGIQSSPNFSKVCPKEAKQQILLKNGLLKIAREVTKYLG